MTSPRKKKKESATIMAFPSTSPTQRVEEEKETSEAKSSNSSKSCFMPTVCLNDWWLIRAEKDSQGRTLAVAGLTSRQGQALRVFSSAPILKIYDVFNLETVDGVYVVLKGFINKSRSEENGFSSEVFEQFLFGFPPQWEAFNENCLGRESKEVKDPKKLDHKDHIEATGEKIQERDGREDYEVEDNLMRDNQNDGEVASEVIVQKKVKRSTRSSGKLNLSNTSTSIGKERTAEVEDLKKLDQKDHVEATGEKIQDHNGREDYEIEDNLMRDNQNDGEVSSEVIVQKKIERATRSSGKLNSTNTSTSIEKEQIAEVQDLKKFDQKDHVEATGEKLQDYNGSEDYEVEDNLMRDNQNDGEVASEVIVQKKIKRAKRSSGKLNSTHTSSRIAKEQTAEVQDRKKLDQKDHVEATGEKMQDQNVREDFEVGDNQNDGEVAGEVILQKKIKRTMRSSGNLNSINTPTSIAKEQTAEVRDLKKLDQKDNVDATSEKLQDHGGREDYEVEDNLMRDNQNDGEVAGEVIVQKKIKRATSLSGKHNSIDTSIIIAKEQTAEVQDLKKLDQKDHLDATGEKLQDHNGRQDYEVEDNLMRDNQNDEEVASEVIVQKKIKRTRSSGKLDSTNTSAGIAKEQNTEVQELKKLDQKDHVEATREKLQDHNGREDYEVEDNLMSYNLYDIEVASEINVQKKIKRATRSSGKLNSTTAEVQDLKKLDQKDHVEATGEKLLHHNGREDYELGDNLMRDNQNDGEVASEFIVQKKIKRATRSLDKLNFTNTSTSIAKEQTADANRTTHFKSASASTKNAKRKLTYGSPQLGRAAAPLVSPETLSFNRSRSGRVLLPPMAFWRNQRAVYDADQRVTEVKQGDPNLDNLSRVSRSEPSRKRRQH